jgi:Flp pilus assembly protein TadB
MCGIAMIAVNAFLAGAGIALVAMTGTLWLKDWLKARKRIREIDREGKMREIALQMADQRIGPRIRLMRDQIKELRRQVDQARDDAKKAQKDLDRHIDGSEPEDD